MVSYMIQKGNTAFIHETPTRAGSPRLGARHRLINHRIDSGVTHAPTRIVLVMV